MGHGKHSHMSKGPEMGHSPNEMGHSPNEMSADLEYNPIDDIEKGKGEANYSGSWMSKFAGSSRMGGPQMKGSPNHKYDRVVLGGNKEDKSKTKPGKKDY